MSLVSFTSDERDSGPISRPQSLTGMVAERIRASIIDGSIPLGALLSEKVLAERFNVSKTPVREALVQLTSIGLVDILPQRGGLVFRPDENQVRELCEVRSELESVALRLSMQRDQLALAELLDAIVRDMEEAFSVEEPKSYQLLDASFHNALFTYCGNGLLSDAYGLFNARISALRTHLSTPHPYLLQRSLEEHRWLSKLVRRGDKKSASSLLDEHIARTREFHLKSFENHEK
jgi:DNA-binding GntR family transcriptional regulator